MNDYEFGDPNLPLYHPLYDITTELDDTELLDIDLELLINEYNNK
jgi:hypothetical protein